MVSVALLCFLFRHLTISIKETVPSRHVAADSNITASTLTHIVKTVGAVVAFCDLNYTLAGQCCIAFPEEDSNHVMLYVQISWVIHRLNFKVFLC